jgi:glutathione-regulated potassium-efflux system ancillary protein KefG
MNKILIIFTHPLFEKSRVHNALTKAIPDSENITFHDLYEAYPDFNIMIQEEKERLLQHDIIIWQHPFYWYSIPPLLKQWIDLVLEFGWAYGPGGEALKGKIIFNVVSTGGREEAYSGEGRNRFTVRQFLAPLEQTVRLCNMNYIAPFVIHGTHLLDEEQIENYSSDYQKLLRLIERIPTEELKNFSGNYLNEIINNNI